MTRGRKICDILKEIRLRIAQANGIRYTPQECDYEGECQGTCPVCEADTRYLERQLQARRMLGRAVAVAGISASLFPTGVAAQSVATDSRQPVKSELADTATQRIKQQIKEDDLLFGIVEENAQFRGGDEACMKWIKEHLRYPEDALRQGHEGRVIVSFVVERDGHIDDVKVLRSPYSTLDAEAVRLVKSMPKWKPAHNGNKTVRTRFNLPIIFHLQ